ncbi:hypothetical protein Cgig2_015634 [Carnegiea gigantea]|uniref:Transmembrane protein n=1 Tax=Carnegiea gigantea TaxID=171969 RepID=A0A9Q1JQX0_9CARY|nr:hypothetical protein Cgig2_015634 [Carnegiea gigantea]
MEMEVEEETMNTAIVSKSMALMACTAMSVVYVAILYAPALILGLAPPTSYKQFMIRRFFCAALSSFLSLLVSSALLLPECDTCWYLSSQLMELTDGEKKTNYVSPQSLAKKGGSRPGSSSYNDIAKRGLNPFFIKSQTQHTGTKQRLETSHHARFPARKGAGSGEMARQEDSGHGCTT